MKSNLKPYIAMLLLFILTNQAIQASQYSIRKYNHVKKFYKEIYKESITAGLKFSVPPAAIMAIAGLESGYGSGYVAQITGNILSLGAYKGVQSFLVYIYPTQNLKKSIYLIP